MKITDSTSLKGPSKIARRKMNGARFTLDEAEMNTDKEEVASVGSILSIGTVSALLAVQGQGNRSPQAEAIRHGHDLLDVLDGLKLDLLSGRLSRQKLDRLISLTQKNGPRLMDASLQNVLDHIELRARVELAKRERYGL